MPAPYSQSARDAERLETGDKVFVDQTVTIRVRKASKRVTGAIYSKCLGGCGASLADDEKASHKCPGPAQHQPHPRRPWRALSQREQQRILTSIKDKARISAIRAGASKNEADQRAKAAADAFRQRQRAAR